MTTLTNQGVPARMAAAADRRCIAVVALRGVIGGAVRTESTITMLEQLRVQRRVRAVLLDIDSPGGGATASEALYFAVRRLAEEKPVVAWIRGTGASGAYFAACGATRTLAFPSALVGSIGVISVRPVLVEALQRVGARVMVTKTGEFKDLGAPWREPTEPEREKEQQLVDAIFRRFRSAVRDARGFDDRELARVTTGEVWLAEHALEMGLIDGLAVNEDEALTEAQHLAEMPHRRVVRMHRRRTLMQRLGVPGAGLGPPGIRWIMEIEGWLRAPRARL